MIIPMAWVPVIPDGSRCYAENNQEAYDNMVQAFRISEHKDVRLPIMICQDGFITSHAVENIELLEDA